MYNFLHHLMIDAVRRNSCSLRFIQQHRIINFSEFGISQNFEILRDLEAWQLIHFDFLCCQWQFQWYAESWARCPRAAEPWLWILPSKTTAEIEGMFWSWNSSWSSCIFLICLLFLCDCVYLILLGSLFLLHFLPQEVRWLQQVVVMIIVTDRWLWCSDWGSWSDGYGVVTAGPAFFVLKDNFLDRLY